MTGEDTGDSIQRKLIDGEDVNILIVGDSIGAGSGASRNITDRVALRLFKIFLPDYADGSIDVSNSSKTWYHLLADYLRNTYGIHVRITNISMGGNTSYAGYVRAMSLDHGLSYDLAIVCYGQNDAPEDFSLYYESLLRSIIIKYECPVISILESSQGDYTDKMMTIRSLCEYYGIPVADTIRAFQNTDQGCERLSEDGIHPNDAGYKIYYEVVRKCIEEEILDGENTVYPVREPWNQEVRQFDTLFYAGIECFERVDERTYLFDAVTLPEIQTLASDTGFFGFLGIDYTYESGENVVDIYLDGNFYTNLQKNFNFSFSQRRIVPVGAGRVEKEIRIVFQDKKQADGFMGLCFSAEGRGQYTGSFWTARPGWKPVISAKEGFMRTINYLEGSNIGTYASGGG